jgi:hypothetical protein
MFAFYYNLTGNIEESLRCLSLSNQEGLSLESEEVTRAVMVSILENYLNMAHAQ